MGADKYEVLGTLGTGATGTVYLAYEAQLDRNVALKELAPALVSDPVFIERFRAEARIMAGLDHPNCVKVYDFFEEDGRAVLVSEYVEGASLRKVLDHAGYLVPEQALGVLKGALSGLAYAHGRGLVHRDLKPDNLLADQDGVSKLADFGQTLVHQGPGAAGGMPAGTPAYMSPEMVTGGLVDLRSDIYSLGAMLFEFLTGRAPFTGDNPMAVMRKQVNEPPPDPRSLRSDLPEAVGQLVTRAMAKDPAERQRTAEQFLDELEAAAVAGYGEDWEKRSSIKRLVQTTMAALGLFLAAPVVASAATGGSIGEAVLGGVNKWLLAGGIAGGLLVLAVIVGFASGALGGRHQGGAVSLSSPSPQASASATESPSPGTTPSPSPSPSPSASPSPTPSASQPATQPSPGPSAPTAVRVYNLALTVSDCGSPQGVGPPTCRSVANPAQYNSQKPYAIQAGACSANRGFLELVESYDYQYVNGSAPVTVTAGWTAAGGTAQPPSRTNTISPPSASFTDPQTSQMTPAYPPPSAFGNTTSGSVTYAVSWQDSRQGTQSVALGYGFNWQCR